MGQYASGKFSIGICSRCKFKVPYKDLREDGNVPGLYVCQDAGCYDKLSRFKKPPRQPDAVALHHARPDVPLYPILPTVLGDPDKQEVLVDPQGNIILPPD
jgi:hypothetical protein